MSAARRLLAQRHLAVLICAVTLALRLLVPTGYMIDSSHGQVTLTLCSGTGPATVAMEMPGMDHSMPGHVNEGDHGKKDHGKTELPCTFASLSAAALPAIDPVQLAALIAFVMAVGLIGIVLPVLADTTWLRPPLRGPPAYS